MDRTGSKIDTPLTKARSAPVRYELVDKDGRTILNSESVQLLERVARNLFPDQPQDEDRTGKGWDVRVVGS